MIDLALVFERLRPGAAYLLSSSVPPHVVVEWRGPGVLPSEQEIFLCWADIEKEKSASEKPLSLVERLTRLEKEVFK